MKNKSLIIFVAVALVALILIVSFMQLGVQENNYPNSGENLGTGNDNVVGEENMNDNAEGTIPEGTTTEKNFVILANDNGFYINGEDVGSISTTLGDNVMIKFNVDSENVYYAGLDFRGCGIDTDNISPGGTTTVEFTAENTCTITSYWPSSNIVKDRLEVMVS